LKVSISDFLTLFSCRTGENWFWATPPANILMAAGGLALMTSTILACSWPSSYPDKVYTLGLGRRTPKDFALFIWLYCLTWWVIQDAAKVLLYHYIKKFNFCQYNETGQVVLPESTKRYIQENKKKDLESASKGGHH
jgi:H+-transporting ATPase